MGFTPDQKRFAQRQPRKDSRAAASPDAAASAASGSGGDAAFIQDPRSARRDRSLIPFASGSTAGTFAVGLNALPAASRVSQVKPSRHRTPSWAALGGTLALLLVYLSLPSAASAARGHQFTTTFGTPCAAAPCGNGELKEPSGVAVNEATGNVYVVDKGDDRVEIFSAGGAYLGFFDGSGASEFEGVPQSGTEAGAGGLVGESGGTGTEPGERGVATGRLEEPEGIAVDNSAGSSQGDVYVVDAGIGHRVIDKFTATGGYVGQITASNGHAFVGREELDGVAADAEGVVWVYRSGVFFEGVIDAFTYSSPSSFELTRTLPISGLEFVPRSGFAADSQGDFYVRQRITPGQIAKLDASGAVLTQKLDEEDSTAVAVEQCTDNAFVENLTSVAAFDPEGRELERLGQEAGAQHLVEGAGIASSCAAQTLYVADAAAGKVVVFGPKLPDVPLIESESLADVTAESVDLGGQVNPRSEAGEAETTYRFQYGPCPSLALCSSAPYGSATPEGTLPPDFEVHPVAAHLQGLLPGTTYHFRLMAENSHNPLGTPSLGPERTFTTQTAGGELTLPDGRGWELVSPPEKNGALILPIHEGLVQAAAGGGAIAYLANAPTEPNPPGYSNLVTVVSSRAGGSWNSQDVSVPHIAVTGQANGTGNEIRASDRELTAMVVQPFGEFNPGLSAEASESTAFLRDLSPSCGEDCFRPLATGKVPFANVPAGTVFGEAEHCRARPGQKPEGILCGPRFKGATEDLSHIVLEAQAELAPGAGREQIYEWASGRQLTPLSVLPGGEPAPTGSFLALNGAHGAISADGNRVVWETPGQSNHTNGLFLRANSGAPQSASGACDEAGRACTIQLDAAEPACLAVAACESGGGRFQIASADGSRIFFTDEKPLTADSGAAPGPGGSRGVADLYECRVVEELPGHLTCDLTDLTPEIAGKAADVRGSVLGASEDGSYVYFVAEGILGQVANARGETAALGSPNLYLRHGAVTSFITTLAPGDKHDWAERLFEQPTRVSADGRFLELMSEAPLTGYDNRDIESGRPVAEVYLYDADSNRLVCASCVPTGARPAGVEYLKLEVGLGGLVGGEEAWAPSALVAANVPGWTSFKFEESNHQPRYLSGSGRLFFNTADALVPQDSNATQDVYEYEPPGVGGCTEAGETFSARSGGCVGLISAGASKAESGFLDASESGDDVFFLTSSRLGPRDVDAARDVYDARVGGGEAEPPRPVECSGDACQQPATPPVDATPGSLSFSGAGNVVECPKGKVKKSGKCVKKQQKKAKKHKKKHGKGKKKSHKRAARSKRGGAK
jgi:DNA-binding beta-propeller fold protein YncE